MMNSVFLRYSLFVFLFSVPSYAVTVVNLSCNIKLNPRPALDEGTALSKGIAAPSTLKVPLKIKGYESISLVQNSNGLFLISENTANYSEYLGRSSAIPRVKANLGGGFSVVIEKDLHVVLWDLENPLKGSFRINAPINDFKTFSFQRDLSPAGSPEIATIVASANLLVAITYSNQAPLHKSFELEFEKVIESITVSKRKVTETDGETRTSKERMEVKVEFYDETTEIIRFENGQLIRTKNP